MSEPRTRYPDATAAIEAKRQRDRDRQRRIATERRGEGPSDAELDARALATMPVRMEPIGLAWRSAIESFV